MRVLSAFLAAVIALSMPACAALEGGGDTENSELSSLSERESEAASESLDEGSESESESESEQDPEPAPYVNPLTGEATELDLSGKRPVAVMINNLYEAMPQLGISKADILYECAAEGGVTRLMMVTQDYGSLNVVGSVRSAREYFLDFAQNHDALYVHAGGSTVPWADAYAEIAARGIDNMDGVNMYIPNMFYRDPVRLETMSMEHTLVTTGARIEEGIQYLGYRTELSKDIDSFLTFGNNGNSGADSFEATSLHLPITSYQNVDYDYDSETGRYLRYQFNGMPHIDGETGEQLSFKNILIIYCDMQPFPNDSDNRMNVQTLGEGVGYYITNGRAVEIIWKKASHGSPTVYYTVDGSVLTLNSGNTMINICDSNTKASLTFNSN